MASHSSQILILKAIRAQAKAFCFFKENSLGQCSETSQIDQNWTIIEIMFQLLVDDQVGGANGETIHGSVIRSHTIQLLK